VTEGVSKELQGGQNLDIGEVGAFVGENGCG